MTGFGDMLKGKVTTSLRNRHSSSGDQKPLSSPATAASNSGTRMKWPPRLSQPPTILGEIKDISGRNFPRDIGRSIQLGTNTYYIFGDTFCFSAAGEFTGVTNNTIALIPSLAHPTQSQYLQPDDKIPEFIPSTLEEQKFTKDHEQENRRIVNWCFGGVVTRENENEGWLYYDKIETEGGMGKKEFGMGEEEPRFGSISAFDGRDNFIYLLGGKQLANFMARLPISADFTSRSNYQFLLKNNTWAPSYSSIDDLQPVLGDQAQGAILYAPAHGPEGKPWIWMGVDKWMSNKLHIAASENPQGPWDIQDVGEIPDTLGKSGHRYCLYPHTWGGDAGKGEWLVSWSDDGQMGGCVCAAKLSFVMLFRGSELVKDESGRVMPLCHGSHFELTKLPLTPFDTIFKVAITRINQLGSL
ncbi:hypothetical protein B7494_g5409 [Chlorociboria aeruginascens]|nr:hypothetical protein B7494_g5409 [Chlorociboria aeruginascens]